MNLRTSKALAAALLLVAAASCTDTTVEPTSTISEANVFNDPAAYQMFIARLYAGQPQHPVARALAPAIQPFGIKHEYLAEIIDGMQMDLSQNRYLDFDALEQYCHRVAGVVGLLAASIFGYRDERTLAYAHTLGLAFQLTNIIRDVGEDSRKGRIYLPLEDLRRFGYAEEDLFSSRYNPAFIEMMRFETARAWSYYKRAEETLPREDRKAMVAAEIMRAIYSTLLRKIEDSNYNVFSAPPQLSKPYKLYIAFKTWIGNRVGT